MSKAVSREDIIWGYLAQLLNMGAGLLLLPVILRFMGSADVALWFVFIALAGFAQLLEFGFQPTLARNAAYVYAGANEISAVSTPTVHATDPHVNGQLLSDLLATSRYIYRIIAALAAVVLLGAGSVYVYTLLTPAQNHFNAIAGWIAFAAGYLLNFYFGYFGAFLQGRGDVRQAAKVTVCSRGLLIVIGSVAVVAGFGLLGLGIASLLASLTGRLLAKRYYETAEERARLSAYPVSRQSSELMAILWANAKRLGVVHLGAFLIQRGNILVGTSYLGLAAAASYSLTMTLMLALVNVGMVVCNVSMPYMSSLQIKGDIAKLRSTYAAALVSAVLLFLCGGIFLLVAGNVALASIGAKTQLLPKAALAAMLFIFLLELHHSVAANYITTTNNIPFVKAAIVSGSSILIASLWFVTEYGVWALIVSQGLVQAAYNNWKWPVVVAQLLGSKPWEPMVLGIRTIGGKMYASFR